MIEETILLIFLRLIIMEYFNANTAGLICRQYYFKQHRAAIHILIIGKKSGKWHRISTSLNLIKIQG